MAGFLPYGGGGTGLWSGSFVFSVSAHAAMTAGLYVLYTTAPPPAPLEERTAFTVTLQELDADSLTGTVQPDLLPPEGEGDGTDGDDPDAPELASSDPPEEAAPPDEPAVETPEDVEVETADPVEVETPDTVDVETADPLEVETPDTVEVDAIEQVTPTIPEEFQQAEVIEVPDAVGTLDGVVPDTAIAVAIDETATASTVVDTVAPLAPIEPASPIAAPVDLSPIAPVTEASPLTPDIAAAVSGGEGGSLAPVAPVIAAVPPLGTAGPSTTITPVTTTSDATVPIAPVAPPAEQVASVTTTPPPPPPPPSTTGAPPSAQDVRLGELITRIRATPAGERCLIALPRRDGPDGVGLSILAASELAMETYAQTLLTDADSDIRQTRTLIDQRQCAALSYIAANGDYPATRMGISSEFTEIPSGENFTGVLRGAAGRFLTLLIVDDNGVVQDLQRFTSFSANLARFDVPVNRAGPPRDTKQILLAIATRRQPTEIREQVGRLAEDVFGGLPSDLTRDAALGVLTFDVR